jgi:hypothetical protein
MAIWHNNAWLSVFDYEEFSFPVTFVAIPTINNQKDVEFEYPNWQSETAYKVA